jgi:hypothetical protein
MLSGSISSPCGDYRRNLQNASGSFYPITGNSRANLFTESAFEVLGSGTCGFGPIPRPFNPSFSRNDFVYAPYIPLAVTPMYMPPLTTAMPTYDIEKTLAELMSQQISAEIGKEILLNLVGEVDGQDVFGVTDESNLEELRLRNRVERKMLKEVLSRGDKGLVYFDQNFTFISFSTDSNSAVK